MGKLYWRVYQPKIRFHLLFDIYKVRNVHFHILRIDHCCLKMALASDSRGPFNISTECGRDRRRAPSLLRI